MPMMRAMQVASPVTDNSVFRMGDSAYRKTCLFSWLLCSGFFIGAIVTASAGFALLGTYSHVFTFYLKWQDALVALLWFTSLITLVGCVLILRFQFAVRAGYIHSMLELKDIVSLSIRDLSTENLGSIFWMIHAAFWCFVAVLVGLVPLILIGWTLHIPDLAFAILATGAAILLSLAGIAVSAAAGSFIIIGGFGFVSFLRSLGAMHSYELSHQTTLRLDGNVLAVSRPGEPETNFDLNTLNAVDQQHLLSLIRTRANAAQSSWTLEVTEEESENKSAIVLVG